jgi:2,4-dienoyl-CoA reductase-like NADH-dependent reductase (Old Yellow Enzyme family)
VTPEQAESLQQQGQADLVALGREALYSPNWAVHTEAPLGVENGYSTWPRPYRMWLAKRAEAAGRVRAAALLRRLSGELEVPG